MEPHILLRMGFAVVLAISAFVASSCISINLITVPEECTRIYPGGNIPSHCSEFMP